jgi:hypothetical protein
VSRSSMPTPTSLSWGKPKPSMRGCNNDSLYLRLLRGTSGTRGSDPKKRADRNGDLVWFSRTGVLRRVNVLC